MSNMVNANWLKENLNNDKLVIIVKKSYLIV